MKDEFTIKEEYRWLPLAPFVESAFIKWISDEKTVQSFGYFYVHNVKLQHTPNELYEEIIEESYKYEVSKLNTEIIIEKDLVEYALERNEEPHLFGFRCLVGIVPLEDNSLGAKMYTKTINPNSRLNQRKPFIKLNNTVNSKKTSDSEYSNTVFSCADIRYTKQYMVDFLGEPDLMSAPRSHVEKLFKLFSENS